MSTPRPIDVRLEISSMQEPIEGRLSDRQGRSVEFQGWIELSSALSLISAADVTKTQESKGDSK